MHSAFFTVAVEGLGPVVAAIGGGVLAALLGLPQGVDFESTMLFEVGAVALVVGMVGVVGYGLVSAVRDERGRVAARRDAELRTQLARRMGCEL
jgi:hypothetical protein